MRRVTLTQYLVEQQRKQGIVSAELRLLIEVVARACKSISNAISKGALAGVLGGAGSENVQGEAQKKLDVIANDVLVEANEWGGHLAAMASEEMDLPLSIPNRYPKGEYLLVYDPLDGSSNIDVNVSVGTIFSVLRCPEGVTEPDEKAFLQAGSKQVAAGFAVYGPATILVLTVGNGTVGFTLDRDMGSWIMTQEKDHDPRGHRGIRHQYVERAQLDAADQALHRRMHRRQKRPTRQGFQHALGGVDGGRRLPHSVARRRIHVSGGCQTHRRAPAVAL